MLRWRRSTGRWSNSCDWWKACSRSIFGMYLARERRGSWSSSTLEHHTPPQPFYGPFPGPPGWAGARRGLLDFMEQRKINYRGRHTDHPVGRHSIRTDSAHLHWNRNIFARLPWFRLIQDVFECTWQMLELFLVSLLRFIFVRIIFIIVYCVHV